MRRCIFTRQAELHLAQSYDYIRLQNPSAALRMLDVLQSKCKLLSESPDIGRHREELALMLRSFPAGNYVIFYRPVDKAIEVIRILHGARDIDSAFFGD